MYIGDQLPHFVARARLTWPELATRLAEQLANGHLAAEYVEALGTGLLELPPAVLKALCQVLDLKPKDLARVGDPTLGQRRTAFESYVQSAGLDLAQAAKLALYSLRAQTRAERLLAAAGWRALDGQRAQLTFNQLLSEAFSPPASPPQPASAPYMLPCPRCGAVVNWALDSCPECGRLLHQPDD
jgi:hypothetical protein